MLEWGSMNCERCEVGLIGNQKRWCSLRCSKLGLKRIYRKRRREHINAYKRARNKMGIRSSGYYFKVTKPRHLKDFSFCAKCGVSKDLEVHHIKPLIFGGGHKGNLITLCKKHHYEFEQLTKNFWVNK